MTTTGAQRPEISKERMMSNPTPDDVIPLEGIPLIRGRDHGSAHPSMLDQWAFMDATAYLVLVVIWSLLIGWAAYCLGANRAAMTEKRVASARREEELRSRTVVVSPPEGDLAARVHARVLADHYAMLLRALRRSLLANGYRLTTTADETAAAGSLSLDRVTYPSAQAMSAAGTAVVQAKRRDACPNLSDEEINAQVRSDDRDGWSGAFVDQLLRAAISEGCSVVEVARCCPESGEGAEDDREQPMAVSAIEMLFADSNSVPAAGPRGLANLKAPSKGRQC